MSRGDDLRLEDIREACRTAAELVARGRGAYDSDPALPLALERLLGIVGEAAAQLVTKRGGRTPGCLGVT